MKIANGVEALELTSVTDGQLSGPNPLATFDMNEANKSLKKLAQYDIETVICYHGGVFRENAQQRILQLAE